MDIKSNRTLAIIIVTLIYAVAGVASIIAVVRKLR